MPECRQHEGPGIQGADRRDLRREDVEGNRPLEPWTVERLVLHLPGGDGGTAPQALDGGGHELEDGSAEVTRWSRRQSRRHVELGPAHGLHPDGHDQGLAGALGCLHQVVERSKAPGIQLVPVGADPHQPEAHTEHLLEGAGRVQPTVSRLARAEAPSC